MEEILFSVIVPAFCAEDSIRECLFSVLRFQNTSFEIIVVDDGSTDRTLDIITQFALNDKRIKVVHKDNGGLSSARNAGLKQAIGKYIVFLDADDMLIAGALEKMERVVKKDWPDIVIGDAVFVKKKRYSRICVMDSEDRMQCFDSKTYLGKQLSSGRFWTPVWFNIYNNVFLRTHHLEFVNGIFLEDDEWTIRAFSSSSKILYSGICLYQYIIRQNSIMQQKEYSKHVKDGMGIYTNMRLLYSECTDKKFAEIMNGWIAERYLVLYTTWPREFWKYGISLDIAWILKQSIRRNVRIKAWLYYFVPRTFGCLCLLKHKMGW